MKEKDNQTSLSSITDKISSYESYLICYSRNEYSRSCRGSSERHPDISVDKRQISLGRLYPYGCRDIGLYDKSHIAGGFYHNWFSGQAVFLIKWVFIRLTIWYARSCLWYHEHEKQLYFTDIAKFLHHELDDAVPFGTILSVLKRLEKDGFVEYDDRAVTPGHPENRVYRLTFDGRFRAENGGYLAEADHRRAEADRMIAENIRAAALERFQRANANRMTYLTIILVVGTVIAALYYSTELYWRYHWFH